MSNTPDGFLYSAESFEINRAAFEVHKKLGIGLLEAVYQDAMEVELAYRKIPFEREKKYEVIYRDTKLKNFYVADFVCYDKIIVEFKAVSELLDVHKMQVLNYLRLSGCKLGLLYNFHEMYMKPVRILNSRVSY